MNSEKESLIKKRDELLARLTAIREDYQRGLDPDSEERAQQLENAEVLEGIQKATSEELDLVEKKLADLG